MPEDWTIKKLLDWTTDYFKKHNIEWPHLEAEILLAHALSVKRIELYTQHEKILDKKILDIFRAYIQRRIKHEPIAYITGYQPFMSLDFEVNPSVLIPRPETEKLVEVVIDIIQSSHSQNSQSDSRRPDSQSGSGTKSAAYAEIVIADIGTGSGCIAVSLAKYLPNIKVIGTDLSIEAIEIAKKNAEKHGVSERCKFLVGNLFEPLNNVAAELALPYKFDLIIANPPYIPTTEIDKLMPDVKDFEPRSALDGGVDGLDYYRKIISEAPKYLKENGSLALEIGLGQEEKVKELLSNKFIEIKTYKDLAGIPRVICAILN